MKSPRNKDLGTNMLINVHRMYTAYTSVLGVVSNEDYLFFFKMLGGFIAYGAKMDWNGFEIKND